MIRLVITFFCINLFVISFSQNQKFTINWAYGLAGGSKPTAALINKANALDAVQANSLVKYFLDSSGLDFKCVYNGCQNRAMVMSLLLQQKGIRHYKIWNFDPFKMAIFNLQDALDVADPLQLKTDRIVWDFHVAIAVLVKNAKSKLDTLVIDPSFAVKPMKVSAWLSLQNSPNSYYTFLDPEWYNYVTLQPGTSFSCSGTATQLNIPTCFPYLLTGDYYKYDTSKLGLIAEELATNEQITKAANEIVRKLPDTDVGKASLIALLVKDFSSFKNLLGGAATIPTDHPFNQYLPAYREAWAKSANNWRAKLEKL